MPASTTTWVLLATLLTAGGAEADEFHGWSADGTWYAWQRVSGPNDLVELFFCQADDKVAPSWPENLNELDRSGRPPCVRLTDPNRAPLGWKQALKLPRPSTKGPQGITVEELVTDGDDVGYVVQLKKERRVCRASGLSERSKLGHVWFHPSGRLVAAMVDGHFFHCDAPLAPAPPTAAPPPRKKGKH